MNNIIEFKKDCIMKTMISEITDISLTHDYKVLDDVIEGYFDISGEYKVTKASMQKEEFMYTIPFSIALSSLIDRNSINLTIKDFNYEAEKDLLHLKISLNMNYQEISVIEEPEPVLEEKMDENFQMEGEEMVSVDEIMDSIEEIEDSAYHDELMNTEINEEIELIKKEEIIKEQEKIETEESIKSIISGMKEDSYYKYKVYIMRKEDTIESIAIKYNVTLDILKEYNNIEEVNIGDKIVIPYINTNAED